MRRNRSMILLLAILAFLGAVPAVSSGQIVEGFPLHAIQLGTGECAIGNPCEYGPNTAVFPGFLTVIYIWGRNVPGNIAGIQTAFDWDPGTWILVTSEWNCQVNQVTTHVPSGPGPLAGTITTTFDCITVGGSLIIGKLYMLPSSGCLRQVQSALSYGTCIFACPEGAGPIDPVDCGTICVNEPGVNACWPEAVESATWGRIKSQW